MRKIIAVAALLMAFGTGAARAADQAAAYINANEQMMRHMAMMPKGDADHNFAAMMLPHHKGAVDMARIELQYGKDPGLRAMAKQIVDTQAKEIEQLQAWLKAHPQK